jgi:hypothetical protein
MSGKSIGIVNSSIRILRELLRGPLDVPDRRSGRLDQFFDAREAVIAGLARPATIRAVLDQHDVTGQPIQKLL